MIRKNKNGSWQFYTAKGSVKLKSNTCKHSYLLYSPLCHWWENLEWSASNGWKWSGRKSADYYYKSKDFSCSSNLKSDLLPFSFTFHVYFIFRNQSLWNHPLGTGNQLSTLSLLLHKQLKRRKEPLNMRNKGRSSAGEACTVQGMGGGAVYQPGG